MAPHEGQDIAKGSRLFAIPSRLLEGKLPVWSKRLPKERYQAVEPQEQRRRTRNGQIRPWALRREAQVRPALRKRGFHTPALHELAADRCSRLRLVGGEHRFRWPFSQ